VWRRKAAGRRWIGRAPARKQPACGIKDGETCMAQLGDGAEAVRIVADVLGELGDIDSTHRVEGQVCGALRVGPLLEEVAVGAEDLKSDRFTVAHEAPTVGCTGDPVRQPELARTVSGLAPRGFN